METLPPMCYLCARVTGSRTCEAFPKGIPDSIYLERGSHRAPVRGDGGVVFEPFPDLTPTERRLLNEDWPEGGE